MTVNPFDEPAGPDSFPGEDPPQEAAKLSASRRPARCATLKLAEVDPDTKLLVDRWFAETSIALRTQLEGRPRVDVNALARYIAETLRKPMPTPEGAPDTSCGCYDGDDELTEEATPPENP